MASRRECEGDKESFSDFGSEADANRIAISVL